MWAIRGQRCFNTTTSDTATGGQPCATSATASGSPIPGRTTTSTSSTSPSAYFSSAFAGEEAPHRWRSRAAVVLRRTRRPGDWRRFGRHVLGSHARRNRYVARNSEAAFAVVEDQEQVDELLDIKADLDRVRKFIYWDPKGLVRSTIRFSWGLIELLHLGEGFGREHPDAFEENVSSGSGDDVSPSSTPRGRRETHPAGSPQSQEHEGERRLLSQSRPLASVGNFLPSLPPALGPSRVVGNRLSPSAGCHPQFL